MPKYTLQVPAVLTLEIDAPHTLIAWDTAYAFFDNHGATTYATDAYNGRYSGGRVCLTEYRADLAGTWELKSAPVRSGA